jgi:murein DD-endopeptidase MepM/ murein hydrolase activator NlpD
VFDWKRGIWAEFWSDGTERSGRATGVHLHYEVRVGNVPVDPMLYVRRADDPSKVASR